MDIERELKYIHKRIAANSKANHIALMAVQTMLEISANSVSLHPDETQKYQVLAVTLHQTLTVANEQINEMNAEFKDVVEDFKKRTKGDGDGS